MTRFALLLLALTLSACATARPDHVVFATLERVSVQVDQVCVGAQGEARLRCDLFNLPFIDAVDAWERYSLTPDERGHWPSRRAADRVRTALADLSGHLSALPLSSSTRDRLQRWIAEAREAVRCP